MPHVIHLGDERRANGPNNFLSWALIALIADGVINFEEIPIDPERSDRLTLEWKVNGVEVDPRILLRRMKEEFDNCVQEECRKRVEDKGDEVSDIVRIATNKIRALFPACGTEEEDGSAKWERFPGDE